MSESGTSVAGVTTPGVNASLVAAALATDFADTATLDFKPSNNSVQSGAERVNAATGIIAQFQFGSWLSKAEFRPSLANCATEADKLLATTKINFLSGSTDLGPRSQRAINALASIMARCVSSGLTVELGGHTDNTGSGIYELSAARAVVVGEAMIARGVPREAISAVGFGPSKLIADNATEAGRAANRRTTVSWAQQ